MAFAELCAKSNFSLLRGASRPEEMVVRAKEIGLSSICVADRGGLYGSVRTHMSALKTGLTTIVGAEVPLGGSLQAEIGQAVLLVKNDRGYANLCRLLTRAHQGLARENSMLAPASLAEYADGLFLILDLRDCAGRASLTDVAWMKDVRDAYQDQVSLASVKHFTVEDARNEAFNQLLSRRFAVSMVATARPICHVAARKPLADVLACIRLKTTLDGAGDRLAPNSQAFLHAPSQMEKLFRNAPERVTRSLEIASECRFSLSELRYSFPCDELTKGESPDQALRRFVDLGLRERYPSGVPDGVREQVEKELELIQRLKVAPFFLSVYDIVDMSRTRKILCQGRGSAANSAVCFALGITAVDPARSNLLFERFLSAERNEPPDIDVDFEHERREEVIQAIYEKYGRDRAAMVSEVITYRGRSALREVSKVFGLSIEQSDRLAKVVGHYDRIEHLEARVAEAGFDPNDHRIRMVLAMAAEMWGFPRHMSTHVGGFVLSARPLSEVAPVEPAKMPGRTVVPWDKDDIDDLGFFKIDVLGLGMLTAIRKALELVHVKGGSRGEDFDPIEALASIPPEDPVVYEALCRADTVGVFQIESRAQMAMLPRMRPRCFYDLVIEVAIVRPGPIQGGMVHPYLRRRNKEEAITMPHPSLAHVLERTLGVPLFQEQVMQIAMDGAGYGAGEADQLRRDMAAWRKHGRLARHRDALLSGFAERGISAEFAERLFQQIQGFGEYGFPESHASSFALLVYASAWLKVHHPAEFACALLNSQPMGFYAPSTIVRDAQKHGVEVLGPDVMASTWDSSIETSGARRALRLGLRLVRSVGEDVAHSIEWARARAPFRDIKDLAMRARLRKDQVEALAEGGALESLTEERRQAIWKSRAPDQGELFRDLPHNEPEVTLARLPPMEKLRLDYARLGLSVSDHPLCHLRRVLTKRGVRTSKELPDLRQGAAVKVAGLVLSRQRPATASGIVFVTLEDETGFVNLILRPEVFDQFRSIALGARLVLAQGKLERTPAAPLFDGPATITPVIHLLVKKLEKLELPSPGALEAKSRDFR